MDWDDLRYFLAVVRLKSLTGASEQLGVSQSTVSRRIDTLERRLGIVLFARHQTGYGLTDAGLSLVTHAEAVENATLNLEAQAAGATRGASGTVRLATAENLASHVIIPALPRFRQKHPEVTLDIVTGIAPLSFSRRDADLALRLTRPQHGDVTVRRLGEQAYALYGSRAYLAARPQPVQPGTYTGHSFIGWDDGNSHLPMAQWLAKAMGDTPPVLMASSLQGHLAAARAGLGLALLPCFLADPEEGLVRVAEPAEVMNQTAWLVIHSDLAGSARVRAVAEFLAALWQEERHRMAGTRKS